VVTLGKNAQVARLRFLCGSDSDECANADP